MADLVDTFRGTNAQMVSNIEALIDLSDQGALSPHPLGGHARELLASAAVRLRQLDEADRIAGEATRQLRQYKDDAMRVSLWRDRQKREAGFSTNISFDVVWERALAALLYQQADCKRGVHSWPLQPSDETKCRFCGAVYGERT